MNKRIEMMVGSTGEAFLVLVAAAIGFAVHAPLIFASLGPTAYELVEKPRDPSSRVYNVIVGHLIGLGAGFLSLYLLATWHAPSVTSAGFVSIPRIWTAGLAVFLTTLGTIALKARQPAAAATTLLISLGGMQTSKDALSIVVGVLIITLVGEPIRRIRIAARQHQASVNPSST